VVFTINVVVAAVVPLMVTEEGIEQVGTSDAPDGELVSAQLTFTWPVKPPAGVTEITDVLPVIAPGATVMLPLLVSAIDGTAETFTVTVVLAVAMPVAVAFTVNVYAPLVVPVWVATVSVLLAAVVPLIDTGVVTVHVGVSVEPPGELVIAQVRFTAPVNPPTGLTLIAEVFPDVAPAAKVSVPGFAPSDNPATGGVVVTVIETTTLDVIVPVAEYTLAGVAAVVATVSVDVAALVPVTVAAGALQVIPAGDPVTAQVKFTAPVKPPVGVTVSVDVVLFPTCTKSLPLLLRIKLPEGVTVTVTTWLVAAA
jgi:acyl dehydratase